MSARVIDLDEHRPHAVAHVLCRRCGHLHLSVHPVAADAGKLECPLCGAQDSEVHLTVPGECRVCDEVRRDFEGVVVDGLPPADPRYVRHPADDGKVLPLRRPEKFPRGNSPRDPRGPRGAA